MQDKDSAKLLGRRQTIHLLGLGIAAGGILGIAACKGKEEAAPGGPSPKPASPTPASPAPGAPATEQAGAGAATGTCDTPFDKESKQTRMVVQYRNPAAVPEKHCSVCAQYVPAKFGDCGGCKLFAGPVNPNGGCLSFAPLNPSGAPAPAKSG